nr:hypothetical protein [Streptococcus equi]
MTKADYPETQIFYESPYRVKDTLTKPAGLLWGSPGGTGERANQAF